MRRFNFCIGICLVLIQHAHAQDLSVRDEVAAVLRDQIMKEAAWALRQQPSTITAYPASRSVGSIHDFYSEGDYWWPNPDDPTGPYIQRDGMTNPDNFVAHRQALIRFSKIIGALASAYLITQDEQYAQHAVSHVTAWFISPQTRMNPNLLYAQAISGRVTGRGIGIIDTIHLMEVAQSVLVLEKSTAFSENVVRSVKAWFADYVQWLTTHEYGITEMNAKNNHGTCWVMQVAAFAKLTANQKVLDFCSDRFKNVLLPGQMDEQGGFPLERQRTKPYGYSLFNLDAMVMICQILSDQENDLWTYTTPDGKSIRKGIEYLYPFIKDKSTWPLKPDVMYWDNWPVAQPFLVFGAAAFQQREWVITWKNLDHQPETEEVIRNLPIRNPLIWMD